MTSENAPAEPSPAMAVEVKGIVKKWIGDRGFGFLMPDGGGDDVWVHKSELKAVEELSVGDRVTFIKVDDGKGRGKYKARDVKVTEAGGGRGIFTDLLPAEEGEEAEAVDATSGLERLLKIAGEGADSISELAKKFVLLSSLECPFLVLSETQLVGSVPAPSSAEFQQLLGLVDAFVAGCEACGLVMLIDFEGEMPGYGGELITAQFQLTDTVDAETLEPRALPSNQRFCAPGLLVDLRSEPCIAVARRVLESSKIIKFSWGARGDCQSLMYQELPVPLRVSPAAVVDAQLAFDSISHISMARMLKLVPRHLLVGLPGKEQIDWDAFHSRNQRALPTPLGEASAIYAVDDMHRMEAIIGSKRPPSGSYVAAQLATDSLLATLREDPYCISTLEQELMWLEKQVGKRKTVKAVQVMRHVLAVRARDAELSDTAESLVTYAAAVAHTLLWEASVVVPADLSFNPPPLEAEAVVTQGAENWEEPSDPDAVKPWHQCIAFQ